MSRSAFIRPPTSLRVPAPSRRSYVYIITSPMVPSDVPLPTSGNGGGAAAAASPCAWLVLLLAALAAVVMMAGSSPALRA